MRSYVRLRSGSICEAVSGIFRTPSIETTNQDMQYLNMDLSHEEIYPCNFMIKCISNSYSLKSFRMKLTKVKKHQCHADHCFERINP